MAESEAGQEMAGEINVGRIERWFSVVGGGALLIDGLRRRSWLGLAAALAGGVLVYRGATGTCPVYHALGIDTTDLESRLMEGIREKFHAEPSQQDGEAAPVEAA